MTQQEATIARWLYTWVTILALVVVVVIGFLLGIVHSLDSIDGHLGTATSAVVSIGGHAVPLSGYIQDINGNLTSIDADLKPIPAGAITSVAVNTKIPRSSRIRTSDSAVKAPLPRSECRGSPNWFTPTSCAARSRRSPASRCARAPAIAEADPSRRFRSACGRGDRVHRWRWSWPGC